MPVDGIDQAGVAGQGVHRADAAVGDAAITVADLVVEVARGEHRPLAALDIVFVEPAFDSPLALGQLPAYLDFHSKSFSLLGCLRAVQLFKHRRKTKGFRGFSFSVSSEAPYLRL